MKKQKKILLIDDDEDDWFLFRETMKKIDDMVVNHYFQDAVDAIRFLSAPSLEKLPDYIFLDLNMPRMNGRECLMEIKNRAELAHIPVIILSTSDLEEDIYHARLHGAFCFVTKPYKLKLLEQVLRFILSEGKDEMPAGLAKWVRLF